MTTILDSIRASWAACQLPFLTLVGTMLLDIVGGMVVAFGTGKASSTISRKGIARKVFKILTVALCAVLDAALNGPVPLATLCCLFYMKTEGLSLLEKAGKLGIIPPGKLLDALAQVREAEHPTTVTTATVSVTPTETTATASVGEPNP